jgi:steroid 5-alpha reductase family enzyme
MMATTTAVSAGALALGMVATWALSLALRDVSIVDVACGLGFVLVAWIAFATGDGDAARRTLLAVLTTVWGSVSRAT